MMPAGRNRRIVAGVLGVAALVPLGAAWFATSSTTNCGVGFGPQVLFWARVWAVGAWLGSLVLVGAAVRQVRHCGYSAGETRSLWRVFGLWKLLALVFAMGVGLQCIGGGPVFGIMSAEWIWPAAALSAASWLVLLFSLVVLIVVGPDGG